MDRAVLAERSAEIVFPVCNRPAAILRNPTWSAELSTPRSGGWVAVDLGLAEKAPSNVGDRRELRPPIEEPLAI